MPGTERVLASRSTRVTPIDPIGPLTVPKTPGIRGARPYRRGGERAEQLATDTPLQLVPAALSTEVC
jgi:hypothetical protein